MNDSERLRKRAQDVMTQISRNLRQRTTNAEETLWNYLRDRRFEGIKFRRQYVVYETLYVVDFYCHESRLVVELDGGIHDDPDQKRADAIRQADIEELGYYFLRFRNEAVFEDLASVLTSILTTHTQRLTSLQKSRSAYDQML